MSELSFRTAGVRIGRIKGIDIWVHWTLLLLLVYQLYQLWIDQSHAGLLALELWGLATLGLFLTILLHELGHCYAAYRMGGGADHVLLWPLGGLAYCDAPNTARSQFWVAAGGPLVNVAIAVLMVLIDTGIYFTTGSFLYLHIDFAALEEFPIVRYSLQGLFWLNIVLLIFNLLPIYPLDGGRIFQAIMWRRLESYGRATLITIWASRIGLLALLILSFFPPLKDYLGYFVFAIIIWAYLQTERLRQSLHEREEDSVFGYDFSRGYTSLERTMPATKQKARKPGFFERLRQKREERERRRIIELRQRVDAILQKISTSGMASLTPRERRLLEQASKKLKD